MYADGHRLLAQRVDGGVANLVYAATPELPDGTDVGPDGFHESRIPGIVDPVHEARERRSQKASGGSGDDGSRVAGPFPCSLTA